MFLLRKILYTDGLVNTTSGSLTMWSHVTRRLKLQYLRVVETPIATLLGLLGILSLFFALSLATFGRGAVEMYINSHMRLIHDHRLLLEATLNSSTNALQFLRYELEYWLWQPSLTPSGLQTQLLEHVNSHYQNFRRPFHGLESNPRFSETNYPANLFILNQQASQDLAIGAPDNINEIFSATELGRLLPPFYQQIGDVSRIYYLSASQGILALYPWQRTTSLPNNLFRQLYQRPHYQQARHTDWEKTKILWSEPYTDFNGNETVITATVPVMQQQKLVGTLSIDLKLNQLAEKMRRIQGYSYASTLLVSNQGKILGQSDIQTCPSQAQTLRACLPIALREKAEQIQQLPDGVQRVGWYLFGVITLHETGWRIFTILPADTLVFTVFGEMMNFTLFAGGLIILFALATYKVHRLFTERRQLLQKMEKYANHDTLTGINNRRYFFSLAEPLVKHHWGHQQSLVVLVLDIDHFKQINDTHGHAAGDKVLMQFAQRCQQVLRGHDVFGRIGGEEFAVVLPHTSDEQGLLVAERLRNIVAYAPFTLENGIHLKVTVSIGLASPFKQRETLKALLDAADQALYTAKANGRNRVEAAPYFL